MEPLTENKIVLIVRKTRLDELVSRFNTEAQARFYIEHLDSDFSDYKKEDIQYKNAVRQTQEALSPLARLHTIDRSFISNYIFSATDTVVVLGQDGLVANVLKYLDGQPVIGVNPDPRRWEGSLLPFTVDRLRETVLQVFEGKRASQSVTMAQATLNTGLKLHAVNDLFIGQQTHTSARYHLRYGGREENQSSSGIIVSTGLGSTGWLRSIITGAIKVEGYLSHKIAASISAQKIPWDANFLFFSVREPWPSTASSAEIVFGQITPDKPLLIVSQMAENGVIFSDGLEKDFIEFNSGTIATISIAEKHGRLVV